MLNQFSRTQLLFGEEAMNQLSQAKVAVFGIGGVGGYVCEALVRSGVGSFDLVDDDKVCLTNLNRQIIATRKTVGKYKAEVMKERMLEINPEVDVTIHQCFFLPENAHEFPFAEYDYIVDAVDTVTAKIELIMKAKEYGVPIISAMGAGNKLDPGRFHIADIYDTRVCPLAKVMRRELKKRNIKHLKVVYSDEEPTRPIEDMSISCRTHCICPPGAKHKCTERRDIPGSNAFVPAVAGLMIAGEVVKDLSVIHYPKEKEYQGLKEHLTDLVLEEQAKLGYRKESIRFYFPVQSLQHLLASRKDISPEEMQAELRLFPSYVCRKLGTVTISHEGERFCFYLGDDFVEKVYQQKKKNEFVFQLVSVLQKHSVTMEDVEAVFAKKKEGYIMETCHSGEFDVSIRFQTGKDKYVYCFKKEGTHITYHRFLEADYALSMGQ